MAKLGFSWYPKDWQFSKRVFKLTLAERGIYRELIDNAMMTDNKQDVDINLWIRMYNSNLEEMTKCLNKLKECELIIFNEDHLFVPECEARLQLIRGGSKGGKNSKKKVENKPTPKPSVSLSPSLPLSKDKYKVKDKIKDKVKVKAFTPPTEQECFNYFFELLKEKQLSEVESKKFIDYYQSKGWLVGKSKMKDWKSAVRNWVRRNNEKEKKGSAEKKEFSLQNELKKIKENADNSHLSRHYPGEPQA